MTTTTTQEGPMTSDQAAPGVLRLGSDFINYYAVEEGGRLTLIDAGAPKFADTLEPQLAAAGFGLADVEAVVLTHSDSDHTGVVPLLQRAGARILIHEQDEPTLRKPRPKTGDAAPSKLVKEMWRPGLYRMIVAMTRAGAARPTPVEGAETFGDGQLIDVPGSPRVIHAPGHTAGESALHLEERSVLFAGDALCSLNPMTRSRGPQLMPHAFNVSNAAARASLAKLEDIEAGVVLFGHGEPWTQGAAAAVAAARERLS
jgi:glyoxylase-like metal-dependent hydrolase (beta-lactamase superfamily II)